MNLLLAIKWRAVLIALFAFFVAPLPLLFALTSLPNFFGFDATKPHPFSQSPAALAMVLLALAPVGAAYFAAKLAGTLPLLHGLVTGVLTGVAFVLLVRDESIGIDIAMVMFVTFSGLFGGWLQRYRNARPKKTA